MTFHGCWFQPEEFRNLAPLSVFHREHQPLAEEYRHPESLQNLHMLVQTSIFLKGDEKQVMLRLTADDCYQLRVNGQFAGQGPAPGYYFHYYWNEIDVTELVHPGENRLEFHLLGKHPAATPPHPRVVRHGPYTRDDFRERVRAISPHVGAVFTIVEETWCHTLTEMWSAGLPAVVFDFPTVAGRVRESGAGWVVVGGGGEHVGPLRRGELQRVLLDNLQMQLLGRLQQRHVGGRGGGGGVLGERQRRRQRVLHRGRDAGPRRRVEQHKLPAAGRLQRRRGLLALEVAGEGDVLGGAPAHAHHLGAPWRGRRGSGVVCRSSSSSSAPLEMGREVRLEDARVAEGARRAPARGVRGEVVGAAKGGGKVAPEERLLDLLLPLRKVGGGEHRLKGRRKVIQQSLLLQHTDTVVGRGRGSGWLF